MSAKDYITDSVISKDGTKIGYRIFGSGTGILLVHGGMMYSNNFMKFATVIDLQFTHLIGGGVD